MAVSLSQIVMSYPGTLALDQVSAEFRFDEVHGLIGENGAERQLLSAFSVVVKARPLVTLRLMVLRLSWQAQVMRFAKVLRMFRKKVASFPD